MWQHLGHTRLQPLGEVVQKKKKKKPKTVLSKLYFTINNEVYWKEFHFFRHFCLQPSSGNDRVKQVHFSQEQSSFFFFKSNPYFNPLSPQRIAFKRDWWVLLFIFYNPFLMVLHLPSGTKSFKTKQFHNSGSQSFCQQLVNWNDMFQSLGSTAIWMPIGFLAPKDPGPSLQIPVLTPKTVTHQTQIQATCLCAPVCVQFMACIFMANNS